jgi:hypothetical protein
MRNSILSSSWPSDVSRTRLWTGSAVDVGGREYLRREGDRSLLVEQGQLSGWHARAKVVTYFRSICSMSLSDC